MRYSEQDAREAAGYLAAMVPPGQQNGVMPLSPEAAGFAALLARAAGLPIVQPDRDDQIADKVIFCDLITISGRTIRLARRRWGDRLAVVWVRRDGAAATPNLVAKVLIDDRERVDFPKLG